MISLKHIWTIIPARLHRRTVSVLMAMLAISLLELVGIATLYPLLLLLLNPASPELEKLCRLTGYSLNSISTQQTVLLLVGVLFLLLIGKNIIVYKLHRFRSLYLGDFSNTLSNSLFAACAAKGLLYHKRHSLSDLAMIINQASYLFVWSVLLPLLSMLSEGLLLVITLSILFLVEPMAVLLTAGCLLPVVFLIIGIMRRRIGKLGQEEYAARSAQIRVTWQMLRGYATAQVYGYQEKLEQKFSAQVHKATEKRRQLELTGKLPGMLIEMGLIVGVGLAALFSTRDFISTVALFGAAGLRIIPSLRTLLANWSQIKNQQHTLDNISRMLQVEKNTTFECTDNPTVSFVFEHNLRFEEVSFAFDDKEILSTFSLTINSGDRIILQGPSGRGKSTFLQLLVGLYFPSKGQITIDNIPLDRTNVTSWQSLIGYVPQDVFIFDGTLAENIAMQTESIDEERILTLIDRVKLTDRVNVMDKGIYESVGDNGCRLSGGERQRIGIARALYRKPKLLVFDEATSAVDGAVEKEIFTTIEELSEEEKEITIIVVSHRELPWKNATIISL